MKIQYASDLHLEFVMNRRYIENMKLEPAGDILVLAGDIGYLEKSETENSPFFDWCSDNYRDTFIVPGNHEYYYSSDAGYHVGVDVERTMKSYEHCVRPNVRYVNNMSFCYDDLELFFTTLWSAVGPLSMSAVQRGIRDCREINFLGHTLNAQDMNRLHSVCSQWLGWALDKSEALTKIVVSHHCPTVRPEFKVRYENNPLDQAFRVSMDEFIAERDIDYWIYGHTHCSNGSGSRVDSRNPGGTCLLCNQLGYVHLNEDADFRRDAVVTVD